MKQNKIRLLSIGHSYVLSVNRSILREVAKDPEFRVTVVAPRSFRGSLKDNSLEPEPLGSALELMGVDCYLTSKMHFFTYNPIQLAKIFKTSYDLAHFWEEPYILAGYQLARSAHHYNLPFCVRTAQSLVKEYPWPFSRFEQQVSGWCRGWVAGGQLVHQAMIQKGWDEKKGQIISLSVDTDLFKPFNQQQKEQVKSQLGLDGVVLGFLGRLTEAKGCEVFMKTIEKLNPQEKWSVLMMGSGPYEEKIKKWALEKNLHQRIHIKLLNHLDVPKVLPVCDLLLCPSQTRSFWKEQFGRMIVEAFAAGVPVIGSDSGEIPNVIGDCGVVVSEANVEEWVTQTQRLMDDREARDVYAKNGLLRAEQFSSQSIANKYKKFYRNLLEKQK